RVRPDVARRPHAEMGAGNERAARVTRGSFVSRAFGSRLTCVRFTRRQRLPASIFMWQFLYFLPLPQGHGSLRPTFAPTLRIGSAFFFSPALVCIPAASSCAW